MTHIRDLAALALAASLAASGCNDKGKTSASSGGATAKPTTPAPTGQGVIEGTVSFAGGVPAAKEWGGKNDAACAGRHAATIQLVSVEGGKLADAFVYVKKGAPEGSYKTPETPAVIDQKACEFAPRVLGVMNEQPITWGNSDPFMHNVNTGQFNQGLAAAGVTFKKALESSPDKPMVTVRCDVHPWMRAYVWVMDHPYFQVTKADGAFKLSGMPDGEYTIGVWHEVLPVQEKTIKVAGSSPAKLDFEMKP